MSIVPSVVAPLGQVRKPSSRAGGVLDTGQLETVVVAVTVLVAVVVVVTVEVVADVAVTVFVAVTVTVAVGLTVTVTVDVGLVVRAAAATASAAASAGPAPSVAAAVATAAVVVSRRRATSTCRVRRRRTWMRTGPPKRGRETRQGHPGPGAQGGVSLAGGPRRVLARPWGPLPAAIASALVDFRDYDTRLAAYAVIEQERGGRTHVLLALWNEGPTPKWTMPGGGVELEETVEQAAVREVREETGYDVELGPLLGVHTFVLPPHVRINVTDRPLKSVRVVFSARVTGGELRHEVDGTTDEARWIALDEVAGLDRVSLVDIALGMGRAAAEPTGADRARQIP
jgi:8-oxo-dGTP diphosphatase